MDVFSSALKNPLPPTRKKTDLETPDPAMSLNTYPEHGPQYEPASRIVPNNGELSTSVPHSETPQAMQDNKKKNSRRRHRNSHLGCGVCKKRRIKCDEHLPQCFNCIKGRLHCAYLNLDAPARNALRLAQYNQNLRDEREDESAPKSAGRAPRYNGNSASDRPQAPLYPTVINPATERSPVYSDSPPMTNGNKLHSRKASSSATNRQVPQHVMAPPLAGPPSMAQSMYVPVIQLQPMNSGMPYSQLPMQMMAAGQPQAPPVMYLADHGHMQVPAQHMPAYMYYLAQPHGPPQPYEQMSGSYVMPMQRMYGQPNFIPDTASPYYPQDAVKRDPVVSPPTGNTQVHVPRLPPSSSLSPVAFGKAASTPCVPSLAHSGASGNSGGLKDFQASASGPSLNTASLGPTPPVPTIASPPSNPDGHAIKLAPIQIPNGGNAHGLVEKGNALDNEKISSINMLLS